jgi:hypothetical protein
MGDIRLIIATPVDGLPESADVKWAYASALSLALQDPSIRMMDPIRLAWPNNVYHARSRAVRLARELDVTHVLWWDADVAPDDVRIIARLIATGQDLVGCVYPRKRVLWDQAERACSGGEKPVEAHAYRYPYRAEGPDHSVTAAHVAADCVAVPGGLPFGFMLTTRACLDKMWAHYEPELWYVDTEDDGKTHFRGVHLFHEMFSPERVGPDGKPYRQPLSEDYSYCERWRAIGGKVAMYVGPGSPVNHIGGHMFRGHQEGLRYGR